MKITVKYYGLDESKAPLTTAVEVTEEECQIMVERDYELRKQAAPEGEHVTRRSAQEIMNEDFNKPLYNDWHREHRRRSEFPDYQGRDEEDISLANPIEDAPDTCGCAVAGSGCKRNGNAAAVEAGKMQKRVLERRQKAVEDKVAKGNAKPEELKRIAQEAADFEEVSPMQLYVDDITTEKLVAVIAKNHGHAALISSEGGIFDTLSGIYTKTVNIDVMLKGYSGDTIRVDRIGRESGCQPIFSCR